MSPRLQQLATRRERLVAQVAEQRAALAAAGAALAPPGRLAGRLLLVTHVLRAHPVWAAAVAAGGLLVLRRGRAAVWLGRAWMVWRAWQAVQVWLKRPAG